MERVIKDVNIGTYYAARDEKAVIGVMRLESEDAYFWPEAASGTSIYLHKLAVRRIWTQKGVSTALLIHAKNFARELDRKYIRLDCFANRPSLRRFYEKNGFIWWTQ